MLTLLPTKHLFRRLAHLPRREAQMLASRSWQIAPAETTIAPPAFFLPGQLDRVTAYEFASPNFAAEMLGGFEVRHAPTIGYLIKDALLAGGVVYKDNASTFLATDRKKAPPFTIRNEIARGALFGTPGGIRYFGQYLLDDCATYPMAREEGLPVTIAQDITPHTAEYEKLLGMEPRRVDAALFRELVVFDDFGKNSHKRGRFLVLIDKLTPKKGRPPHEGVFILRGATGARRVLCNERELAEQLKSNRGFRILDHTKCSVHEILTVCAGSKYIVGVEGSQLVHAIMASSSGASLLVLEPPFRFATPLKDVADYIGMRFGFVVGTPVEDDFTIELDEVERTLDLMDSARLQE